MKKLFYFTLIFTAVSTAYSQTNTHKDYAAKGYDVVSYFSGEPVEGTSEYTYTHDGVKYKFANQENFSSFKKSPEKYKPQYGGWCAYAMAKDGSKVDINPETYEIRDGKLFLFYNTVLANTLKSWLAESPEKLITDANRNWGEIKYGYRRYKNASLKK